jgi:threonine synthase
MAPPFVTHLECSRTGARVEHDRLQALSDAGAPLMVRYDLAAVARAVTKKDLAHRPADMWRYREFLPLTGDPVSLGEAMTPLIELPGAEGRAYVKDEGRLPTGSFKARGLAVAVSMARAFGVRRIALPTAGNAGAAAAAYGARAGMEVHVFAPRDTPDITLREIAFHGAQLELVDGLIDKCGQVLRARTAEKGWHDLSTLAEPYRIEGKKTMGLELAEQMGWELPDVIYYPTGGGTGFIGMWKAFAELEAVGWIGSKRPRMVAVQTTGCAPILKAHAAGHDHVAEPWAPVETAVHGVRVPKPLGDRLILAVIRESGGHAAAVSDQAAEETRATLAGRHGIHLCPEGAICHAAWQVDLKAGRVSPRDRVVIFNTASGLKSPLPGPDAAAD